MSILGFVERLREGAAVQQPGERIRAAELFELRPRKRQLMHGKPSGQRQHAANSAADKPGKNGAEADRMRKGHRQQPEKTEWRYRQREDDARENDSNKAHPQRKEIDVPAILKIAETGLQRHPASHENRPSCPALHGIDKSPIAAGVLINSLKFERLSTICLNDFF
ncbi:UNVERIFIED_ORG: hypothetical protein GGI63_004507 [Rhizobium esperanzae]